MRLETQKADKYEKTSTIVGFDCPYFSSLFDDARIKEGRDEDAYSPLQGD